MDYSSVVKVYEPSKSSSHGASSLSLSVLSASPADLSAHSINMAQTQQTDEAVRIFSNTSFRKRRKQVQSCGSLAVDALPTETMSDFNSSKGRAQGRDGAPPVKPPAEHVGGEAAEERQRGAGEASTSSQETFKSLGVSDWLCSVMRSLGMTKPTAVQQGCIPAILAGKDVIGLAQTGSGKTAAFALPILQLLSKDPYGVFALVMTPTRELAMQLAEQYRALSAGMTFRDLVIIGGMEMQQQARDLASRPHVVVATPGRLKGLLDADPSLCKGFARSRFLVLDEADRLLDPSFEAELRGILPALPAKRQTLLFSATMTKSLLTLQTALLKDALVYQAYEGLRTADRLKEQYVFIPAKVKEVYLHHLLTSMAEVGVRSAIIFCATCKGCELLGLVLEELGIHAAALHSGKSQKHRLSALALFKSERVKLLLATDVASRGLDIPSVDLVVNYDLPVLARDYVHRVGRTARAGRSGWSLSFVTQYDVQLVHGIEELLGHKLEQYIVEEAEVLKGITKVYSAKRAAMLRVAEAEGLDTSKNKRIKKLARQLDE